MTKVLFLLVFQKLAVNTEVAGWNVLQVDEHTFRRNTEPLRDSIRQCLDGVWVVLRVDATDALHMNKGSRLENDFSHSKTSSGLSRFLIRETANEPHCWTGSSDVAPAPSAPEHGFPAFRVLRRQS